MPHTRLLNPATQDYSFGSVPSNLKCKEASLLLSGPIYLTVGKHIGVNHGFGARHIWEGHHDHMARLGFLTYDDVPKYVCRIVCRGAKLHYEGGSIKRIRLTAVRTGIAILELKHGSDGPYWSIVTAYASNKKHGTLVGTVF